MNHNNGVTNRGNQVQRSRKRPSARRVPSDPSETVTLSSGAAARTVRDTVERSAVNEVFHPGQSDEQCEAMASSCSDSEGRVGGTARPSQLSFGNCEDL